MNLKSDKLIGHIFATLTIIVWGTTFISSKVLLEQLTPLQVMIGRFVIAYITLFIINHKIQKTTVREELVFLLLAVMGTTVYFLFENIALTLTFASNVSILLSVAPILTSILAHCFTKDEKMNQNIFLGSIVAFAGAALVIFNGTFVLRLNPKGDILAFCAALSWAIYSIILKKHVNHYDCVYLARKVVLYSILTTVPILFLENKPFPFEVLTNPTITFNLIFLGVLGSGICYVAWNIATRKLGIVTTNNYIYLSPFVTLLTAKLVLNEKVTIMGVAGALLIIVGVIVAGMKMGLKEFKVFIGKEECVIDGE